MVMMSETILRQQTVNKETLEDRLEKIVQQQAKDKEDILHHIQTFEKQNAQCFDCVENHLDDTKKQLQKQGQQCAAVEATLQQSLTAQNAQILQMKSGSVMTTLKVQLLDNQQEQARTDRTDDKNTFPHTRTRQNERQ